MFIESTELIVLYAVQDMLKTGYGELMIDLTGKVNGLLGLDLLSSVGAVIDLKNMLLYEGI